MLARLAISNYALINRLSVEFSQGLNTITGETGAGKSIILGALGLMLGNRADMGVLKDKSRKCFVEGIFDVGNYEISSFFEQNDLDYDNPTILRREITPSGKSRAFINDTPVNLKVIRELGLLLIDIHSQHQNLELSNHKFQLNLVDTVAENGSALKEYRKTYENCQDLRSRHAQLLEKAEKEKADLDYYQFQYNQLEEARLTHENEQEELEAEQEKLAHSEEIKSALVRVGQILDEEEFSVVQRLRESGRELTKINSYLSEVPELEKRLESCLLELKDIIEESEQLAESIEHDPERIETINDRLNLLYGLLQKHHVASLEELMGIRNSLDEKINQVTGYDDEIAALEKEIKWAEKILQEKAEVLSARRMKVFRSIEESVLRDLKLLGMPKSRFTIEHATSEVPGPNGFDSVSILFSANADSDPDEISRIASGGEMSRLMLAVKNLLRNSKAMPTVIFDEIDSGVSGEIAVKMGNIIKSFSNSTQIINITHLPQIAAKGDAHFQVIKLEENDITTTSIKRLTDEERVEELAKMVGGEKLTESTIQTAQELLNN